MNRKNQHQTIYYANVNVNFRQENVIQTSGGLTINVVSIVKNVMYVKKIVFYLESF